MNYYINKALGFAIVYPAIMGIIKFKIARINFLPFLLFIWIGFLNELVSMLMTLSGRSNAVSSNIYILAEALLIIIQFRRWQIIHSKLIFRILIIVLLLAWISENLIISKINVFNSYFTIFYAFIIAMFSISSINKILSRTESKLIQNPVFIISIAFLVYFTFDVLIETFWIYGLNENAKFRISVYRIHTFINLFSNLMYGYAILWIRTRQKFSLPY